MDDVYRRLAAKLDRLPNGYPGTDSGVELRILAKIFAPEDAELALLLKPIPEPPAVIARRLGMDEAELNERLEAMAVRGQIGGMRFRRQRCFCLVPFVVGIWEFQLERLDAELAGLFEEYAPTLLGTLGGHAPAVARVVPVNVSLSSRAEVLRHEDLRQMMEEARSFRLMDCLCRREHALNGHPCSHPSETCLAFSRQRDAYEGFHLGRTVSREEALEVLAMCEREGLVHCTYNIQQEQMFVCNCCDCCCGFLRGLREFEAPHVVVRSNYLAVVDEQACAVCGTCVERCPVDAIVEGEAAAQVDAQRCIGCGVCLVTCPSEALSMAARPADECTTPPRTIVQWAMQRTTERSGPAAGLAARAWVAWEALRIGVRR